MFQRWLYQARPRRCLNNNKIIITRAWTSLGEAHSPLYIVQKCAPLRGWKKFINVEKIENFTVQKNIIWKAIGNLKPIFYIYSKNKGLKYCVIHIFCHFAKENFSALRAQDLLALYNCVIAWNPLSCFEKSWNFESKGRALKMFI